MSHDPACILELLPDDGCTICECIAQARAQEKYAFNETWKANLPSITRRKYLEGYADGAAGRPPVYP